MERTVLISLPVEDLQSLIVDCVNSCLRHNKPETGQEADRWFDLNELCDYLPDKPKKGTVYGWVHANVIPCHKGAKKLRFLKSEIDTWLKEGKKSTFAEAQSEAKKHYGK